MDPEFLSEGERVGVLSADFSDLLNVFYCGETLLNKTVVKAVFLCTSENVWRGTLNAHLHIWEEMLQHTVQDCKLYRTCEYQ